MPPPKSPPIPTTAANKPPTVNEAEVIRPNSIETKMADSNCRPRSCRWQQTGTLRVMCQVIDSECITRSPSHPARGRRWTRPRTAPTSAQPSPARPRAPPPPAAGAQHRDLADENTTARARNRASAASIINSPAPSSRQAQQPGDEVAHQTPVERLRASRQTGASATDASQPHHDGHQCQQHREPHHTQAQGPTSANTRAATREGGRHHGTTDQQVSASGRRKMEYGLSARTNGWLMVFPSVGFGMHGGPAAARPVYGLDPISCCRVVVAVAHGALGHLAPVAAAVLVARTHHAHALLSMLSWLSRPQAAQRARPSPAQARGWRCTGLRQRGRAGPRGPSCCQGGSLARACLGLLMARAGGWLWRCIGPSWVRAAQLVPPGLEPWRFAHRS